MVVTAHVALPETGKPSLQYGIFQHSTTTSRQPEQLMRRLSVLPLLLIVTAVTPLGGQTRDRARIAAAVDSIVADALKDGRAAGMSVALVRGSDTLVMKGYGFADLEFDVPTPPAAIYEIGSVTKQFTAAAVLLLQEQGKLSLDDELTKHLPDYPTQGRRITIRRLLDHTSGIKGYTEMPEFGELMVRKLPRDTLTKLFAARPFEFEPGDGAIYNNSAYFLLGLVIEKAGGVKYEDFIQTHLFDRTGMKNSRYCSERAVVKNRAHGYDMGPGRRLVRAAYLDHTWPYAGGSICSTVGDLMAWNLALHGGRVLSSASYQELITPGTLNDGTVLRYAKGLGVDSLLGRRIIAHGGGINGFLSDLKYFPDDSLHLAVLVNTAGPVAPGAIAMSIARIVLGPGPSPAVTGFTGSPDELTGTFRGPARGGEATVTIAKDSTGALTWKFRNAPPAPLLHFGNGRFGVGNTRITFVRESGRVTRVRADFGAGFSTFTRVP
jgi:CubicO group peptidase (beta-lactamase class C family)